MTPKDESNKLMNSVTPFAKKMLAEYGEFRPFGGYLKTDGAIVDVAANTNDAPASQAVVLLKSQFQSVKYVFFHFLSPRRSAAVIYN